MMKRFKSVPPSLPPEDDPWAYRVVCTALALTVLVSAGGFVALQIHGVVKAEAVMPLGMGSLGVLSGLLVTSPAKL